MKRLIEREFPPQSLEGEARALLGAVGPHQAPAGMKQRVRARLLAAPAAGSRPAVPRWAWAAAALLVASVAAAAGSGLISHGGLLGVARGPAQRAAAGTGAPPQVPVAPVVPVVPAPAATSDAVTPGAANADRVSEPTARPAAPAPSHPAAKPDELTETNLLFEATRALRREGNPGRASELLSQYFRQFPHGALGEEALALSIEAAQARGDGRAVTLAKRYLKSYPHGHFVDKAERVLEQKGP